MIGNNQLQLCEAMMIQIVQEWVERNIVGEAPRVLSVKKVGGISDTCFEISIQGKMEVE